jgi:hypothetical protein
VCATERTTARAAATDRRDAAAVDLTADNRARRSHVLEHGFAVPAHIATRLELGDLS